jgi:uncharacterized protein YegL
MSRNRKRRSGREDRDLEDDEPSPMSIADLLAERRNGHAEDERFHGKSEETENPEAQTLGTVILDTSGSMASYLRGVLDALGTGLADLRTDSIARARVEIALVGCGENVTVVRPFRSVNEIEVPALEAGGSTPLAAAVIKSLELIEERRSFHQSHDRDVHPAFVLALTDGKGNDRHDVVESASEYVRRVEEERVAAVFAACTPEADQNWLKQVFVREPLPIPAVKFAAMIRWFVASVSVTSKSSLGDRIELPPPPGWGEL